MAITGQRRHKRYKVHGVHGSLLFRTQVGVRNISVSGLAIETTERLQLGRTYTIRLAGGGDQVDTAGTIRWCHLAFSRPSDGGAPGAVYEAGLAFGEVFTEQGHGLLRFLEQHVVLSPHQRLTGRFQAENLGPADLEARYAFEVLQLSLSGLLVRTQLEPTLDTVYGLELGVGGEAVAARCRVAFVKRGTAEKGELVTELGLEFAELPDRSREALQRFIAQELEQAPGEPGSPRA